VGTVEPPRGAHAHTLIPNTPCGFIPSFVLLTPPAFIGVQLFFCLQVFEISGKYVCVNASFGFSARPLLTVPKNLHYKVTFSLGVSQPHFHFIYIFYSKKNKQKSNSTWLVWGVFLFSKKKKKGKEFIFFYENEITTLGWAHIFILMITDDKK